MRYIGLLGTINLFCLSSLIIGLDILPVIIEYNIFAFLFLGSKVLSECKTLGSISGNLAAIIGSSKIFCNCLIKPFQSSSYLELSIAFKYPRPIILRNESTFLFILSKGISKGLIKSPPKTVHLLGFVHLFGPHLLYFSFYCTTVKLFLKPVPFLYLENPPVLPLIRLAHLLLYK